jgi:hypothetical protein
MSDTNIIIKNNEMEKMREKIRAEMREELREEMRAQAKEKDEKMREDLEKMRAQAKEKDEEMRLQRETHVKELLAAAESTSKKIRKIKKLNPITRMSNRQLKTKLRWFKKNRPEQWDCATKVLDSLRECENEGILARIALTAEEKSGKREISEIIGLRLQEKHIRKKFTYKGKLLKYPLSNIYPTMLHACGLVRKDCEEQYSEIRKLGIYAETMSKKTDSEDYLKEFNSIKMGKMGLIVIDELDYASATDGKISPLIHADNSHIVAMSATSWGATNSEWFNKVIRLEPSNKYHGGKWFNDQGLVHQSESFINSEGGFSGQANQIFKDVATEDNGRNTVIVRLRTKGTMLDTYRQYKASPTSAEGEGQSKFINGKKWIIYESFLDSTQSVSLGSVMDNAKRLFKTTGNPFIHIIYICGKLTRSTEIKDEYKACISAWHDNRINDKSTLQALSQAVGRVKHYETDEYPNGHPIKIYTDPSVLSYWENPSENQKKVKNLSARTKGKIKKNNKYTVEKFGSFEEANSFKQMKFGGEFDEVKFQARPKDEHGRIQNNIRGIEVTIFTHDEKHLSYGLSGCGANTNTSCRLVVSYHSTVDGWIPTFHVVWRSDDTPSDISVEYAHESKSNNAYNN